MEHEMVGKIQAKVAAWRHGNPSRGLKVIAVTGRRGKSTTSLLLAEILREAKNSVMVLTNHGIFLNGASVAGRYDTSAVAFQKLLADAKKKNVEYVIVEVNNALIETHVLPTIAIEMTIVTNDSPVAKELLAQPANYTVTPSDFDMQGIAAAPHQAISFGTDESAEAQIARVKEFRHGTEIHLVIDHQTKLTVATYLVGWANALNVAAAISAAYVLSTDKSVFEEGVARLERVIGNYDYLPAKGRDYTVVVDGANDEQSLELVLATAARLKKRRLLVAADVTVSGNHYVQIKKHVDRLVVVGETLQLPGVELTDTPIKALEIIKRAAKKDDLVLLLGREFALLEDGNTKAHTMMETASE